MQLKSIGRIIHSDTGFAISIDEKYRPALTGIQGFSHLYIFWWGHLMAEPEYREVYTGKKPYVKGPEELGIFASRSQIRPNPILITQVFVKGIDLEKGLILTPYIDAEPDTPVLDIKPYYLFDRIRECRVPDWCSHWPKWYEESGSFDWAAEFNFPS